MSNKIKTAVAKLKIPRGYQLYIWSWSHRHGVDMGVVMCGHWPDNEELVKQLGLDYEPDRGDEELEIYRVYDVVRILKGKRK